MSDEELQRAVESTSRKVWRASKQADLVDIIVPFRHLDVAAIEDIVLARLKALKHRRHFVANRVLDVTWSSELPK